MSLAPVPMMPTLSSGRRRFWQYPHLHLSALLAQYGFPSALLRVRLRERERLFRAGPGTLGTESLLLLLTLAAAHGVDLSHALMCHTATLTAAQKQQVLPEAVIVQKTLSLQFSDAKKTLTLVTGLGDFHLSLSQRRTLARQLGMAASIASRSTVNPTQCDPVALFGMVPGMITPFLSSAEPPIAAIGMVTEPLPSSLLQVAISCSLFESLLVPVPVFVPLLVAYTQQMFPQVCLVALPQTSPALELPHAHYACVTSPVVPQQGSLRSAMSHVQERMG